MTRRRLANLLLPLIAIAALVVGLLSPGRRARAAGDGAAASAKAPSSTRPPVAATSEKPAATQPSTPTATQPSTTTALAPAAPAASAPTPSTSAEAAASAPLPSTVPPSTLGSSTEPGQPASGEEGDMTSLPVAGGLPVLVNVAVSVVEIRAFDDMKGEFEATTDLRLRWKDPRLKFQVSATAGEHRDFLAKEAEARLAKIWTPNVEVANRVETSGYVGHRLRIFSDGRVETLVRSTGRYKIAVDVERFPFDTQSLAQDIVVRDQTTDEVVLRFDKEDEAFSRAAASAKLDAWSIGDVDLDADFERGWDGDRYARVRASLLVMRIPTTGFTTIFIPLLASLLIPLLALWMNRPTEEGFEIAAFELANMGIGGLFSVIALSFAVSSAFGAISGTDNTVTRLFALNYATLAISLGVVILFYRFNVVLRLFGTHVQKEVFRFLLWAIPLLTVGTSVAFVLVAAC